MDRTMKKNQKRAVSGRQSAKFYSVGIYARLSVDAVSGGQSWKNESIENQIEMIKAYVKTQENMGIFDCYTDIGKTGTNFKREGFERMMEDVRKQRIDCIIVKDLSRFGRNHMETGNYMEKIFPFMGVRFIAIADHFDSIHPPREGDRLGITLKNLMNEMYAKDISVKVKSAKRERQKQGSYTGGIPPYGYRIGYQNGKKYLIPQEGTEDIVRKIFDLFLADKNKKEIISWLYENGIVRPKDYHRTGCIYCQKQEELQQWSKNTIQMILKNPIYTGCLVQKDTKMQMHTHQAIISEEQFQAAAERIRAAGLQCKVHPPMWQTVFSDPPAEDVFAGLLFCGNCGSKMRRTCQSKGVEGKKVRSYSYCCPRAGKIDCFQCRTQGITFDTLMDIVKKALSQELALSGIGRKKLLAMKDGEWERRKKEWNQSRWEVQHRQEQIIRQESEQYLKYCRGRSSAEEFQKKKKELENRKNFLAVRQKELAKRWKQLEADMVRQNRCLKDLVSGRESQGLNRETVRLLIDQIQVYPDCRIRIVYPFQRKNQK